jgi:hypothetical protein
LKDSKKQQRRVYFLLRNAKSQSKQQAEMPASHIAQGHALLLQDVPELGRIFVQISKLDAGMKGRPGSTPCSFNFSLDWLQLAFASFSYSSAIDPIADHRQ